MKIVLALSGGMDSTTLLSQFLNNGDKVRPVSFFYGSKHNTKERDCVEKICQYYNINDVEYINLDFINKSFKSSLLQNGEEIPEGRYDAENMKSTVVPFRNGIIISILTGYAESIGFDAVALASHRGDHAIYPDCRSEFNKYMSEAMFVGTYKNIRLITPFSILTKSDICKIGLELKTPYELTWTCYKGQEKACGKCGSCTERLEAFSDNNAKDPIEYFD